MHPSLSLLAILLAADEAAAQRIDISTRVANWQGIPNLDNPWIGYPTFPPGQAAGWLGQGASQTFPSPGNCPTYVDNDPFTTNPAIPGCPAGRVVWEATLTINIPSGGPCAIISGTVAADDNVAIRVANNRFPQGVYVIGSATSGIGTWNTESQISPVGQTDANGRGYFDNGANTIVMRVSNTITGLMLAVYLNAYIDTSNCPSSPPPPAAVVQFDPHFTFHHGGKADFKGEDHTWYNLLSAKDVSLNVLFTHADFSLTKPKKQLVHGSRMQEMVATIRTSTGRILLVEFNSTANNGKVRRALIRERTSSSTGGLSLVKEIGQVVSTTDPTPGNGLVQMNKFHAKTVDNVKVSMARKKVANMATIALTISTGAWEVTAWSVPFPNPHYHPGKTLLNLRIAPVKGYDPEKDPVAPHGIVGQSYDGDGEGIDGAIDDYRGDEFTTRAMAEGAIEGVAADYKMASKYDTAFKYSRFGLEQAKPRDATKLSGKRVGKERQDKSGAAGASPDIMPAPSDVRESEDSA